MTSEDDLRNIKLRISQAQSKQARAQVELETAQERRDRALKALKDDFGISTAEDIAQVHTALQSTVDDELAKVLAVLDD